MNVKHVLCVMMFVTVTYISMTSTENRSRVLLKVPESITWLYTLMKEMQILIRDHEDRVKCEDKSKNLPSSS